MASGNQPQQPESQSFQNGCSILIGDDAKDELVLASIRWHDFSIGREGSG